MRSLRGGLLLAWRLEPVPNLFERHLIMDPCSMSLSILRIFIVFSDRFAGPGECPNSCDKTTGLCPDPCEGECDANAECAETSGGFYGCTCSEGYKGNGVSCTPCEAGYWSPGGTTSCSLCLLRFVRCHWFCSLQPSPFLQSSTCSWLARPGRVSQQL
jgi:hypothetical protein